MGYKEIARNKKAYFDYTIEETLEVGIALVGSEVKSIYLGDINLKDSFCHIDNGEVYLKNCYVSPYNKTGVFIEEPRRNRKLLLHRREINRLIGKVKEKGYTLVPTKVYFKDSRVKLEIGLCKGKQLHDKRDSIRDREVTRNIQREIKAYNS